MYGKMIIVFLENCRPNGKFYFAPIDVIFSLDNVRQPDFVFIRNENLHIVTKKGTEGIPDLELLEQFIITEGRYFLNKVYDSHDIAVSPQLDCIHFSLKSLFGYIK
jgi:hypothetical protein